MKYPYKPLVVPAALKNVSNGKLPEALLKKVDCNGKMYAPVADKFNQMYAAAKADGIKLVNIGDYRPFEAQLGLFKERYRPAEDRDYADKKKGILLDPKRVKREYEGKTWLLRNGFAPCSTPGKSNHGLGLAIDISVTDPKVAEWLCAHAPDFGFYLQGNDPTSREFELWHWQAVAA